ncbi:MAG TPA: hypothetical protein EYQ82_07390 [Dehalococcoidia bacterium]|nr:hypothetical protein [Dehalococcoidia bacterium]
MSDIKAWKTPAASNIAVAPDGFPEGMLRSDVNNSSREIMASIRRMWDDPDWKNPVDGFTVVQGADDTKVTIQATNATAYFLVNQKVRVRSSTSATGYAFVVSSALSGADTIVTLEDFDSTGTPTPSTTVPADCNGIDVYFIGGGDTNNHGISRSAFNVGSSVGFEIPVTNDATGINAAIVAASSNGKTVLLPAITITLTDAISIPAASDNLRIMGMGVGLTILKRGDALASKDVITVADDADNIIIENIKIDGNCTNNTTAGHGISFGDNVQNVRLRDLWIVNSWNNAINFGGTDTGGGEVYNDIWIESTKIDTCGNTGIYINDANGTNDRIFISDVSVRAFGDNGDATTSDADGCGIEISGRAVVDGVMIAPINSATQHASFAGSAIRSVKATSGGSPKGGHKNQWSNIRIEGAMAGCTGFDIGGEDLQLSNAYVNLSGSGTITPLFVSGTGAGVEDASDVLISNVFLEGGTVSEIQGTAPRAILNGVYFKGGTDGLRVGGSETHLTGCVFDGQTGTYALQIQNGSNNCVVSGCSFKDLTADGIQVIGDSNTITGCTLDTVTGDGIEVNALGGTNRITGCSFKSITGSDVNDSGTDTEFGRYKRANLTAAQLNIGTSEVVAVGMDAVTFPDGANGSRQYRVRVVLVMNSANNGAVIDVRIRKGTLGTISDAVLYTASTLGTLVSPFNQVIIFDWFILTPAASEMLTVTADTASGTTKDIIAAVDDDGPIVVGPLTLEVHATLYTSHIEMELIKD